MKNRIYILKKDLPGCLAGSLFMETDDQTHVFRRSKDTEYKLGKMRPPDYRFTLEMVLSNPDWFELCENTKAAEKEFRRKQWEALNREFGESKTPESGYPINGTWTEKILFVLSDKTGSLTSVEISLILSTFENGVKIGQPLGDKNILNACHQLLPKMAKDGLLTRCGNGRGWEYRFNHYKEYK